MRIQVLALDGVFDLGLSAVLDTLGTANDLAAGAHKQAPRFDVRVVGLSSQVRTSQGLRVQPEPARKLPRPDVIVVPALGAKLPGPLGAALADEQVRAAGELLARHAARGTQVAAACTGTFVVAEAGLLDGARATTTWWLAPLFRSRYPRVELDESRMVVAEKGRLTAGAALGHLDLALFMVRKRSPQLAALTARYLVLDPRPSQAAYAIPDHMAHEDPMVERFESWARRHLGQRFSLREAARSVGASERTLDRRLRQVLGKSPLAYVQELRVERAVHLLETTRDSVDEIAEAVGYQNGVTLRTLLRRRIGRGVRELRRRTGATS